MIITPFRNEQFPHERVNQKQEFRRISSSFYSRLEIREASRPIMSSRRCILAIRLIHFTRVSWGVRLLLSNIGTKIYSTTHRNRIRPEEYQVHHREI